ncbi:hypothetical protein MTR62_20110, partial [Novosphingobium sp. 1949]
MNSSIFSRCWRVPKFRYAPLSVAQRLIRRALNLSDRFPSPSRFVSSRGGAQVDVCTRMPQRRELIWCRHSPPLEVLPKSHNIGHLVAMPIAQFENSDETPL